MRLIKLAWRNTLRNTRRTSLILLVFSIGVAALVLAWSVFDGSNAQAINNMTGNYTGYVQIHARGYTDDPNVDRAFHAQDAAVLKLNDISGVSAVTERMETVALLSSPSNSRGLILVGVDPQTEPSVTALHQKLVAGTYFEKTQKGGILIGKSLAKVLAVGVGGELAVLTQGTEGSIGAQRYRVQGIYDTQNDMVDGLQAFISKADADTLLSSEGRITTISVKLDDRDKTDAVVSQIRARMGDKFEVEGWKQLLPEVAQSVDFHESVGMVITMILFGIVAIGVANSVLMSVMERMREFGGMMALGTSSNQVFRIIMYEGMIIGLAGFAIGLAIGYALVMHFGATGIEFSSKSAAVQVMQGMTRTIHPHLSLNRMLYISTAVLIVIVAASLYPAWKIANMLPLDAMHGLGRGAQGTLPATVEQSASSGRFLMLTLATRNLTRHPLRTALTMFAITFGLGAFVFVGGIANGFYRQIVENATGMVTGDAQIQLKDFKDDMKPTLQLPNGMAMVEQFRRASGVIGSTPRVQMMAMMTSPTKSLPIMFVGVNPDTEREVTFLDKAVKDGRYLQKGHDKEIVIGRKLAELLRVRVGERVVVMAQGVNGNLASEAFIVSGMFYTGSHSFDDVIAHVNLPAMQNMLGMGDGITNIALRLDAKDEKLAPAMQQLATMIPPGDVKLLGWQELLPEAAQMNVVFKGSLTILLSVVLLMVSVVIMNTVLMSVMERTREFGTMLALGSPPGFIVRLVQLESAFLGLLGTASGLSFGVLLNVIHMAKGVDMKMHGAAIPGVTNIIYPKLSVLVLTLPGILLPILALLAAFYPALRASRLDPVTAIRHV